MWYPFRSFLFFAPDDGAGDGAPAAETAAEPTAQPDAEDPAPVDVPAEQAAAPEPAAPAAQPTAGADKARDAHPDAEAQITAANQRALQAELRSAAALAGVSKERIPYVLRLADTAGIDLAAADADGKIASAIEKVLGDLPELRGGAVGTGSVGNFARKPTQPTDPFLVGLTGK